MKKDKKIIELRKYVYESLIKSENPKHYDMFWDFISFPPEYGGEILFPLIEERVLESLFNFMKKVKEAEKEFYSDNGIRID